LPLDSKAGWLSWAEEAIVGKGGFAAGTAVVAAMEVDIGLGFDAGIGTGAGVSDEVEGAERGVLEAGRALDEASCACCCS